MKNNVEVTVLAVINLALLVSVAVDRTGYVEASAL